MGVIEVETSFKLLDSDPETIDKIAQDIANKLSVVDSLSEEKLIDEYGSDTEKNVFRDSVISSQLSLEVGMNLVCDAIKKKKIELVDSVRDEAKAKILRSIVAEVGLREFNDEQVKLLDRWFGYRGSYYYQGWVIEEGNSKINFYLPLEILKAISVLKRTKLLRSIGLRVCFLSDDISEFSLSGRINDSGNDPRCLVVRCFVDSRSGEPSLIKSDKQLKSIEEIKKHFDNLDESDKDNKKSLVVRSRGFFRRIGDTIGELI